MVLSHAESISQNWFQADRGSVKAMMRQVQGDNREELQQHEFRALMAHSWTSGTGGGLPGQSSESSPMSFQEVRPQAIEP